MGKKSKQKGKGKGKEKTEKKTEKNTKRRLKKDAGEEDIDKLIEQFTKMAAAQSVVTETVCQVPPSPRVNCTMIGTPSGDGLVLFGGEYWSGGKTYVYNELYRYNVNKNEWKQYTSPCKPAPRCSHQAVVYKNYMYIFGGEFTSVSQSQFYHYKDVWRLNLDTNQWEQIQTKSGPSPRSGHRMVLYKNFLVMFGGFYDNNTGDTKYFNDMYKFDLDNLQWKMVANLSSAQSPTPRSGVQMVVYGDSLFVYGGYSKVKSSIKGIAERGVVHNEMWRFDLRSEKWELIKKSGAAPSPRSGFSCAVHNKKMLIFGGVFDNESKSTNQSTSKAIKPAKSKKKGEDSDEEWEDVDDDMSSQFFNDMYAFHLDKQKWYPVQFKHDESKKLSKKSAKHEYESESDEDFESEEESSDTETVPQKQAINEEEDSNSNKNTSNNNAAEPITPSPRIKANLVVLGSTLYSYGGSFESGEREYTYDDLYSLNLKKLNNTDFTIIIPPSERCSVWEDEPEDNDSDSDDESSDDQEDDQSDDDDEGDESDEDENSQAKKQLEKTFKSLCDGVRPVVLNSAETLKEFFARTSSYWLQEARNQNLKACSDKEIRKIAFSLSENRWKQLHEILDKMEAL